MDAYLYSHHQCDKSQEESPSFVNHSFLYDSQMTETEQLSKNRRDEKKMSKKPRTSFTKQQILLLEECFVTQKYLASGDRNKLAMKLNMTDMQVKTWFQNRRTKWRRQEAEQRTAAASMAADFASQMIQSEYVYPMDLRLER